MTLSSITGKITSYIITNILGLVTATKVKEIFNDLITYLSGSVPVIGPVDVITTDPHDIGTIKNGSIINGVTLSTGNIIVLLGQADTAENGIYNVGASDGSTVRLSDFPTVNSIADKLIISKNPDESGRTVMTTVLTGGVLTPVYVVAAPSTGTGTSYANILFVDSAGDDGTGTKGDNTKPFATIEAAVAAASFGDTIEILPGNYAPATNCAKNGVVYYFHPGAVVTKSTSGHIFDCTDYTAFFADIRIYGKGKFIHDGSSGAVIANYDADNGNASNIIFEFESCESISDKAIDIGSDIVTPRILITGNICSSAGNYAIRTIFCDGIINLNNINSSASEALFLYRGKIQLIAGEITSSVNDYAIDSFNCNLMAHVNWVAGVTYGYKLRGTLVHSVSISGNSQAILCDIDGSYKSRVSLHGSTDILVVNQGRFIGGYCRELEVNGGYVSITKILSLAPVTVTAGKVELTCEDMDRTFSMDISGGTVILMNDFILENPYTFHWIISAGKLVIKGIIQLIDSLTYSGTNYLIEQSGGTVVILGTIKNDIDALDASILRTQDGVVILNGATLIRNNVLAPYIITTNALEDIIILSGGANTNGAPGDLLAGTKLKWKYDINYASAPTTLELNDGSGGNESFSEAVLTVKADIAASLVALINASGTLDLTASQDNPGTDEYFYVEADAVGVNFNNTYTFNLAPTIAQLRSYGLNDVIVQALILEDANVQI